MSSKRDFSSTLKAESIRTSLQRLEIGILSVSSHEYTIFAWIGKDHIIYASACTC